MSSNPTKALIVNLSERAGESLKTLLASHLGMTALQASGLQSALRALKVYSPELVFLGFDSFSQESADLLCQMSQQFPRIRCVALLVDPAKEAPAIKAGAHFTLVQGFRVPELIRTVEQALKADGYDRRTGRRVADTDAPY